MKHREIHRHLKRLIASFTRPVSARFMQVETKFSAWDITYALDELVKAGEIELVEEKYQIKGKIKSEGKIK